RDVLVAAELRCGEARVCAKEIVAPGPIRVSARDDRANPGLLEQVSAHARGEQVLPAKGRGGKIARLDVQHTDVVIRLPSHDLRAAPDGHLPAANVLVAMDADAAREEGNQVSPARQAGDVEHAWAFKEDRPCLRKEQR